MTSGRSNRSIGGPGRRRMRLRTPDKPARRSARYSQDPVRLLGTSGHSDPRPRCGRWFAVAAALANRALLDRRIDSATDLARKRGASAEEGSLGMSSVLPVLRRSRRSTPPNVPIGTKAGLPSFFLLASKARAREIARVTHARALSRVSQPSERSCSPHSICQKMLLARWRGQWARRRERSANVTICM